nr:glycine betaine ABC transporter substrate-binding protein [Brucella intermedia]
MVAVNRHGLGEWEIVESSEAAMLSEVSRSLQTKKWIVFLGWEPHPMNMNIEMEYLAGGDIEFGPNYGGATVRTISRKGYAEACPNVARFFSNLVFDLKYENVGMDMIMNQGKEVADVAREMMRTHPEKLEKWLEDVTTFDGKPALPALQTALGN